MKNTEFNVIVCAAIYNKEGQVFLARRSPDKKLGGFWEFPGGKLEHGEEVEQALHREIHEELDIQISIQKLLHIKTHQYNHGAVLILFYLASLEKGEPKLIDHDQCAWLNPNEIENYKLLPANKEVLEILKNIDFHTYQDLIKWALWLKIRKNKSKKIK